jgi:DNA-binding SARP family transcriptional activator
VIASLATGTRTVRTTRAEPADASATPIRIPRQRTASVPDAVSAEVIRMPADPGQRGATGVELRLLGDFQLVMDGRLVDVSTTGQRLLAALACREGPVPRAQLAAALWPDCPRGRAHANLRTTVYRLQRRLPDVMRSCTSHLQLTPVMQTDLWAATEVAHALLTAREAMDDQVAVDELVWPRMQAHLTADLLPDWSEEWLTDHQFNFHRLRIDALEALSRLLAAGGQYGAAVQNALVAVQADPLRDSAHETLIRACVAQGNRNDALAHYRNYRTVLQTELGLDPPPHLDRLVWGAA